MRTMKERTKKRNKMKPRHVPVILGRLRFHSLSAFPAKPATSAPKLNCSQNLKYYVANKKWWFYSFVFCFPLKTKKRDERKWKPHISLIPETNHMNTMHVYSIFIQKFNETRQISSYTRHILQGVPIPFHFQFCATSSLSLPLSSSSSKRIEKKSTDTQWIL